MYQGWDKQAKIEMRAWEVGEGQYWQNDFDPYDPITLTDAHAQIPGEFAHPVSKGNAAAILLTQATIYPEGRMQGILLKAIGVNQQAIAIPASELVSNKFFN